MDYSMMLGIEHVNVKDYLKKKEARGHLKSKNTTMVNGQKCFKIYYLSILDFLQDFTLQKKFEGFKNRFRKGKRGNRSAVNPTKY